MTAERLATLLHEELEVEGWGMIDPYWIRMVADGIHREGDADHEEAKSLAKVLDRVVKRLKEES